MAFVFLLSAFFLTIVYFFPSAHTDSLRFSYQVRLFCDFRARNCTSLSTNLSSLIARTRNVLFALAPSSMAECFLIIRCFRRSDVMAAGGIRGPWLSLGSSSLRPASTREFACFASDNSGKKHLPNYMVFLRFSCQTSTAVFEDRYVFTLPTAIEMVCHRLIYHRSLDFSILSMISEYDFPINCFDIERDFGLFCYFLFEC